MRVLAAVLAAAAATLPLACGDDDEPAGRTVTVPAEPPRPIEIVGDEYFFDPSTVVMTGPGDEAVEIELVLDNRGDLAHNVRVFQEDEEIGGTPTFDGGEKRGGSVRVGAGEYRLVCTVADHEEQGMTGRLVVR
jgi:plastocyanin